MRSQKVEHDNDASSFDESLIENILTEVNFEKDFTSRIYNEEEQNMSYDDIKSVTTTSEKFDEGNDDLILENQNAGARDDLYKLQ